MTTPTSPAPLDLLALAEATAREAGALLMERLPGERTLDTKTSPVDVVTEVDRASEALIVARILEARPDDGFLGEEGADRPSRSGVRWVIDPIDGTVNYLYRRPDFAVCIAAEVEDEVVAGVVFNPFLDELFAAARGHGASLNGQPVHVSSEARLAHALCGTGFGYEEAERRVQGAVVARLVAEVRDIRRAGSAALDLCAVACGRLDVYYERGVRPWDVAAAGLIVREAGGHAGTLQGESLSMDSIWVASNAALHTDFRALVRSVHGLDPRPAC
ncbi:MAG: inositol monophosphatase family protein [Dehalococcoidia bacterium]